MTTKVTIEVPEHADYVVATTTVSSGVSASVGVLKAGERTEIYLHNSLKIVSIEEIPVKAV